MNKILFTLVALFSVLTLLAQSPQRFNYQAVLRDGAGNVLADQETEIKVSISLDMDSDSPVFSEIHNTITNGFGLVNLQVGSVNPSEFENIDWASGPYFIQIAVDGTVMGTSQLLSVPYALHAKTVDNDKVEDADADPANEIQDIQISGTELSISKGSTIDLSALLNTAGDKQVLTLSNNRYLEISNGNSVRLPFLLNESDGDAANELQVLSLSNDTIFLSNGGFIKLPQETDPVFSSSPAVSITAENLIRLESLSGINTGDQDLSGLLEKSAVKDSILANQENLIITESQIRDLNHFTNADETDPVYSSSPAAGITASDVINLGNLSGVNTGDQDLSGLLEKSAVKDSILANQENLVITESQISDLNHFTNADEMDPLFSASVASGITVRDTIRWGAEAGGLPIAQNGNLLTYDGTNWIAKDLALIVGATGNNVPVSNIQPSISVNYIIALMGIYPSRSSIYDPTLGEISMFAGNFAPLNWAFCDGQLLPIAQYQALFSIIGTIYGGDGRTTFALPDLRGRVPVHSGQGPGLTARQLGQKFGTESIFLTIPNLPTHNHSVVVSFE